MATAKSNQSENHFPAGIGQPAMRALVGAGYTDLNQLTTVSEAELKKLHGVGPKALRILGEALAAKGLSFAPDKKSST